jgi:protein-S-isoprenylcysteine O-methyltransferase
VSSFGHTNMLVNPVFSLFRHPSYAGFFYWALGTQMVLQNPLSFILFAFILWRFFNSRIKSTSASPDQISQVLKTCFS